MKVLFKKARRKPILESSWNVWNWSDFKEGDKVSVKRDGPNGNTWVHATVVDSNSRGVTVKWDEERPLLCPTETLRIPRRFLYKNYIRKQNPYDEGSEKNVPIWTITMVEIVNRGNDEELSEDATPIEYSKTYYNADDAWDDAEKLVDEYKDEEGYFQVDVWEGEYETPEGEIINSERIYDIFHMLTGTEGYQGHILFEESLDNPQYDDVEKEFNYKGIVITRYDYESLPDPMAATMMSDEQMQKIAKEMYFDLIDEGWTEQEIEQFFDVDEIADDDDKREMFQDSWWRFMEEEAINAGMKYYEDMDDDGNEQLNESYDDIANDPAYQCPYCGGHNCEFQDAQDPYHTDGYVDGCKFSGFWLCNDCEKEYEVEFELKVTGTKKTEGSSLGD